MLVRNRKSFRLLACRTRWTTNDFKVDAVVPGYVAVKNFAILFHLAEAGVIKGLEGGFRDLEVPEQVQLFQGGDAGYFRSADFIEDDLKHALF